MSVGAVVRIERALLSLLAPLTGTRATGTALVHATSTDVELDVNTYGVPLITGAGGAKQLDPQRMVKTTSAATVTAAGVSVPITSVLGGVRMNLPAGTPIVWTPAVTGVEDSSAVELVDPLDEDSGGMLGGLDATRAPLAKRILVFEGVGKGDAADALWRAKVGSFPAIVISWESAGSGQKVGRGRELRTHRFRLYVVVQRLESDDLRRDEGKMLMGVLAGFLTDRAAADGESFSNPPTQLGPSGKLTLAASSYVYWQEVDVHHTDIKLELRTFVPWTATVPTLTTAPTAEYPDSEDAVTVAEPSITMPQD